LSLHNSILTNHAVGLEKAPSIGVEDGEVVFDLDYDLFFAVTKPISATTIVAGSHNLKADPLFVAAASDNYRLSSNSPAIDRADAADCPAIDLEGNPRPQGLGCDMGAFESAPVLPVIELAPTGLNFIAMQGVAQPAPLPVQVKNIGVGLLSWNATPTVNWLSASPGSSNAPGVVNVTVNHSNLAVGNQTGNLIISGNAVNPSVSLPVTVEVLSACTPLLTNGNFESNDGSWSQSSSTGSLLIQANSNLSQYVAPRPGSQAVLLGSQDGQSSDLSQPIKVPTGAPLSLTYAYFIKSEEGSCGEDEVQVRFGDSVVGNHLLCQSNNSNGWQQKSLDLSAFANQRGILTFHLQNDPIGTPSVFLLDDVTIPVVSSINCSVSNLQVGPSTLTFSAKDSNDSPASQSFTINNSGAAVLNWSANSTTPWFYLNSNQGTTPATIQVSVSPSGLSNGVHNGTITIESPGVNGSPQTVNIVLSINASSGAAKLQVSSNNLSFNTNASAGNPATQSFTISNGGSGVLNWTASEAIPWFSLDATSGTTPAILNATANVSALAVGSYSGNLIISSPGATGSPQVVRVNLTVGEGESGQKIFLPLVSR
ncbi:MAG: choice-of-anchor Q domain-containing protein, partial [Caldilineaceae bacterium]